MSVNYIQYMIWCFTGDGYVVKQELKYLSFIIDVKSVVPSTGSTEGGAILKISGSYYEQGGTNDTTYEPIKVFVGGRWWESILSLKEKARWAKN